MNCRTVTGLLVFLGIPVDMPDDVPRDLLRGMRDFMASIDSRVSGGHTIHSGWPLMGGEAAGIEEAEHILHKQRTVQTGDHLLLTKPLGTQPAMAAARVRADRDELGVDILETVPAARVEEAIAHGLALMTTSLQPVTRAIHAVADPAAIHATTDVTGFGLRGTLLELLEGTPLVARVDQFPVIRGTPAIADVLGYPLELGSAAETAGGMLVALAEDAVAAFTSHLRRAGVPAWDIGVIEPAPASDTAPGEVVLSEGYQLLEIPLPEDQ